MLDSSSHQNLLQALSGTYACIGYISLDSDEIRILHQSLNPDEVGQSYCYSTYLRAHAEEMGHISELYLERLMPQELNNIFEAPTVLRRGFSWTRKRLSDEMKLTSLVN